MTFYFCFLNMGFPEIATILIVALLLLGPQKLPEFARWLGRIMHDLKRTTHEVREVINFEIEREEMERLRKEFADPLLDPTAELKKAANSWMDEATNPPPDSPSSTNLPTSTQTTAPDALQALGILAPSGLSDIPESSPPAKTNDAMTEIPVTDTQAQADNSPKLATIPLAIEEIAPPSETIARGRYIRTPYVEENTEPISPAEMAPTPTDPFDNTTAKMTAPVVPEKEITPSPSAKAEGTQNTSDTIEKNQQTT